VFLWYGKCVNEPQIPRRGRPRTGVTPKRNIRVGHIWDQAAAIAEARGETMTAVIERALHSYVNRNRSIAEALAADTARETRHAG
jgi:hypothetical protein